MFVAEVLIPAFLDKPFSYECDENCAVGQVVCVRLRNRETLGIICEKKEIDKDSISFKILKILQYFDFIISESNMKFLNWVVDYNIAASGMVLKMMLPFSKEIFSKIQEKPIRLPSKQIFSSKVEEAYEAQNLDIHEEHWGESQISPKPHEDSSIEATNKFAEEISFERSLIEENHTIDEIIKNKNFVKLTEEQATVAAALVQNQNFSVSVLDGVTGSGKTETYIFAILNFLTVSKKKQVLILLPEIALTSVLLKRFEKHFGFMPNVWHSQTTKLQKGKIWKKAICGSPMIVIGTRSALFIPFSNLAIIVLDEEHDSSYKQNEQCIYNARDMAVVRAHIFDLPIVLVSATPSLETIHNVQIGRYQHIKLHNRFAQATLPQITLIDMRREEKRTIISKPLSAAISKALAKKEQVLLFLNQRGYAPISICWNCGYRWRCKMCDVNLIYHMKKNLLCCHHCGFEQKWTDICPECKQSSILLLGIGTERVLEVLEKEFPATQKLALSSDTSKSAWNEAIQRIYDNEVNIILGTQILSKGHHFPNLTVVGVINADQGGNGCDLRANEKTYQLLHQVAGRAGREEKKGHVFLQTYSPDNPLMQALISNDRDFFNECELKERQMFGMPPFTRLIAIILSGRVEQKVQEEARRLAQIFPHNYSEYMTLLGPAPAPFARLRGLYRYRLLIKANKNFRIQDLIKNWAQTGKRDVSIQIDVDPYDFV
jgi:primosomal protein N' (replication factor Y)